MIVKHKINIGVQVCVQNALGLRKKRRCFNGLDEFNPLVDRTVRRYAVAGGAIIKATTSIEPTASNAPTAVTEMSAINE